MAQTFSPADFETASQEPLKFSPEDFSSTSTITQQFTPEDFSSDRRTIPTIADTTKGGAPLSLPETALQSTLGEIGEAAGESLSRKEGIGSVLPRLSLTPQDVRGIILDVSPPEGIERSKVEALPPTTLEKVVSGTTQGIEELAKGVADFFTTPSGIAQLGAAVTPIAPAVYAKWTLDMVNAGFTSVQDAVDAYKKSDYARLSKDATVAFGSFLGAAAAAKKGYYELTPILETMPRGDLRGVRVEEAQQKALEATLPKALVESGAPLTAKAVTELPKVPLLSAAQAEAGLFEKIPEASANADIRGLAGGKVRRPLTESESTSAINEAVPLSEPVDPTMDIRKQPIEIGGPNAIPKQIANEEVLGNEVQGAEPQLGLRPLGENDQKPQAAPGAGEETIKKGGEPLELTGQSEKISDIANDITRNQPTTDNPPGNVGRELQTQRLGNESGGQVQPSSGNKPEVSSSGPSPERALGNSGAGEQNLGGVGKAVVPVIIERINKRDTRNWSKLPKSFEQDAVAAAFRDAKELFPKKAISERVRASKATTFAELREAVDAAIKKYNPELLTKGGDQIETQKEKGRQEVLAPTAGETKAGVPQRVNIAGAEFDVVAQNPDGTLKVKSEGGEFDTSPGEKWTEVSPKQKPSTSAADVSNISRPEFIKQKIDSLQAVRKIALIEAESAIRNWKPKKQLPVGISKLQALMVKERLSPEEKSLLAKYNSAKRNLEADLRVDMESAGRVWDELNRRQQPKPIGMGGAVPEEFRPSQAMPSALKNASIDADRVARGEAPMAKAMRKTDPELWDEAMAVIDRDWDAADKLIARFKEQPFTPTDVEAMVLLHRRVDLKNEIAKLSREYALAKDEGRIEAAEAARASRDYIQEKFNELDSIVGRGNSAMGTMQGRAFRARQLMMNEDYSMAALISERQRDVGRKLTEAELEEVLKIADDYARKSAELEKRVEELQKQAEESEANAIIEQAAHDAVRVPKASDYVINLAEKIVADWDVRADKARARLREKFKRTNVGLDPTIIVDLAEIGLSHLGHAGLNFAKWSAKMLEEFKELDATDLKEVYAKSQELADADIIKRAPKEKVSAVKKTITQVSKDLVKSTVERVKKNVAKNPDFNIAFAARKLAREFWIRGIRDPQKMVDAVHEALKEAIPELERRETMDALSGYGKFKPLSKDEVSVGLRDINGQLQQIAKLEDMAQGQAPKKSGFERRAPSDEERRLIKQVEEKKKEGGYDVTDPETQLRTAMQAAERRLENEISDLEHQIETRTKIVKDKRKLTYDDKLQGLRDRRDFLKKVFDDIFKKPELTDAERLQQWKERTQEKIDDYQEQVVSGYFKQRKRPEPIRYDPEAIKLRYELNKVHRAVLDMRLKDELAKRNMAQKIADGVGNTLRFVRAVMTGGEFSGVLRQGGFLFGAHPVIGAKALKQMFQALMSEEAQFKIMEEIQTRPNAPLYEHSKLDFTDAGTRLSSMEEHYMFRVAESVKSIPGVKQGVKILDAFQRAYTTYLNEIRADAFDKLVDTYGNDKVTTEQIANYINVATGRGSRAVGRWTGPGMNTIFFAPRYSISRLQLLTGQPMWHGNAATRKMVAKEYARALSSAAVVYSLGLLWGKANNQSAEETIQTDPRSSDFGKIKIGNSRIDPLAGLAQWTALMAREVSGTTVNSRGKVRPLRENYRMGGHLPKRTIVEDNGLEVAERFGITKLAPGPSSVARFLAGEDFTGQKFTFANELLNAGMPITYGDIYKAMREQGVPNGTAMAILSIFGMGLQTYDVNKRKQ